MRPTVAAAWRALMMRPVPLLLVAPLLWASNIVLGRAVAGRIPPITLAFGRWTVAFLVLLPFVASRSRASLLLVGRHWRLTLACGAFGIAGYSALGYAALRTVPADEVAFLNSALPLVVPVLAWALLGEHVGRRRWCGILLSFGGVLWIVARGDPARLLTHLTLAPGTWLALLGVGNYALYSVLLRRRPPALDPLAFLAAIIGAGLLVLLPFWLRELAQGARVPLDAASLGLVLYTGLFVSLLAYAAWNHCVSLYGAAAASLSYHLVAAFTPLLAYAAFGERVERFQLLGIALILTGFVLATVEFAGTGRHSAAVLRVIRARKRTTP